MPQSGVPQTLMAVITQSESSVQEAVLYFCSSSFLNVL
jgi:hypothetical protein